MWEAKAPRKAARSQPATGPIFFPLALPYGNLGKVVDSVKYIQDVVANTYGSVLHVRVRIGESSDLEPLHMSPVTRLARLPGAILWSVHTGNFSPFDQEEIQETNMYNSQVWNACCVSSNVTIKNSEETLVPDYGLHAFISSKRLHNKRQVKWSEVINLPGVSHRTKSNYIFIKLNRTIKFDFVRSSSETNFKKLPLFYLF